MSRKFSTGNEKVPTFTWGPVVNVHEIGEYLFVENHPQIFVNGCGTGQYNTEKTEFHIYINGKDICRAAESLDLALVEAISYKHDGPNTRASVYFAKMIGAM